jgi:hypothetical protein
VFAVAGELDRDTRDDFDAPPLRASTLERVLPAQINIHADTLVLTLDQALEPGDTVTLAVGRWVVGTGGEHFAFDAGPWSAAFTVAADGSAGADVTASWPGDGASGVPPNLQAIVLGFDGAIADDQAPLVLSDSDERAISVTMSPITCEAFGLTAVRCVQLTPQAALRTATSYQLDVQGWLDGNGDTIDPWTLRFVTGASLDVAAPTLRSVPCTLDEVAVDGGCALLSDSALTLRVAFDEAAVLHFEPIGCPPRTQAALAGDANLTLSDLSPQTAWPLDVTAIDAADNAATYHFELTTLPVLPTLTITETRADPIGPEPQQEYVELYNFGSEDIDLRGYSLSDDAFEDGDTIESSVLIHPRGRVLLVADTFDAHDARDVLPAPAATLVRLGASLANGGLSNGGEELFLRDPGGVRLSQTPAAASRGAGVCLQRIDPTQRDGTTTSFVHDAEHPCTPGL